MWAPAIRAVLPWFQEKAGLAAPIRVASAQSNDSPGLESPPDLTPGVDFSLTSSLQLPAHWCSSKAKTEQQKPRSLLHINISFFFSFLYSLKIFLLHVRGPWIVPNHFPILINISSPFKEQRRDACYWILLYSRALESSSSTTSPVFANEETGIELKQFTPIHTA